MEAVANKIETPERRAQAYTLLGATTDKSDTAARHFAQAIMAIKKAEDSPDKEWIWAEIARVMTRAGYRQAGTQLFDQLAQEVEQLASGMARDIGWALLAGNWARTLELATAESYLARQQDQAIQAFTQNDLTRIKQTISLF